LKTNLLILKKKALIIANTYSDDKELKSLPSCKIDAEKMQEVLIQKGYLVTIHIDLKRRKMLQSISEFSDTVKAGDAVVFFFSGHGISYDGFTLLLPIKFHGDQATIQEESIGFPWILETIVKNNPEYKIFLFDCCRERPYETVKTKGIKNKKGFSQINSSDLGLNVVVASSTSESTVSITENDQDMSLWTKYLIDELKEDVDITLVLRQVRNKMCSKSSQQIPWSSDSLVKGFIL